MTLSNKDEGGEVSLDHLKLMRGCRRTRTGDGLWTELFASRPGPKEDWPELLTEDEAIRFLRLDTARTPVDPYQVLYRYRKRCLLKAVQIGRQVLYPKEELMEFIRRKTEGNSRGRTSVRGK